MTTYAIEYAYDDRGSERDAHRPAHRAYLAGLASEGCMLAYGRYDDDAAPGALLVCEAESVADVESLIAGDPFVQAGLVPDHRIRVWPAVWGPALAGRLSD
ncbi:YciI family protein [Demequina sp. NBRC 110053]|uniref:YciI family protein n=1 Tax=Demequina sp. NBRC 110053 TaxID=1570342 RepID=UPI0009FBF3F6|nr:YciI family protein [Demequina sp. NBRC 110053]